MRHVAQNRRERVCKGWQQEGILRLIENVLSPDVAENAYDLVVYGSGKPVRSRDALKRIVSILKDLSGDETLLIQSGNPVAVFRTHASAPRVLISGAMMVPKWSDWSDFYALEQKDLLVYGQSTAASFAYIGAQGILQSTFETLSQVADTYFDGTLAGRVVLTSGLGGMGSAQPLAIAMNQGIAIVAEVDPQKIQKRLDTKHIDVVTDSVAEALHLVKDAREHKLPLTIGVLGNAVDVYQEFYEKGFIPDIVTDQTPAHDVRNGFVPGSMPLPSALKLRTEEPTEYSRLARESIRRHVQTMLKFQDMGSIVFEYGNHLRGQAADDGCEDAFQIQSFIPMFARDRFCRGDGPLRFIALSGDPNDIYALDDWLCSAFRENKRLVNWVNYAEKAIYFQGLPARSVWLTYDERVQLVEELPNLIQSGAITAPIAMTRDHFAGATMASPHRETEQMIDGSDAVADWPILNALLMASSGATLVSVQHGGGVGIGYSIHTGMTVVVEGVDDKERLRQTLLSESELGVIRYADAGYPEAQETASHIEAYRRGWHGV